MTEAIAQGRVHSSGRAAPVPCWRISWQTNGLAGPSMASRTSRTVISPAGRAKRNPPLGPGVACSSPARVSAYFFVVNVAAPSLRADLHASDGALQLIVGGYAFAYAAGLVTGGRLCDLFGYRRLFVAGMTGFALSSLACSLAIAAEEFPHLGGRRPGNPSNIA